MSQEAFAYLATSTAALIGVLQLARLSIRAFRKLLNVADVILGNDEQGVPSLSARLLLIEHELHPNSGMSLRDSVDRIEAALTDHLRQGGVK